MLLIFYIFLLFSPIISIYSFTYKANHKFIIVYKIKDNKCGQARIQDKYFEKAQKFSNIEKGSCRANGYKKYVGKETYKIPFIGEIIILKYIKNINVDDFCEL